VSAAPLEPADGELIVEARLGRPPQDMLEAAVVLEAWAGVPAQSALRAARTLMPDAPRMPQPSVGRLPAPSVQQAGLLPGAAFIVTVIAIACWAAPLASSLGGGVVERGLMLALPLTLALQWGLQSRYLNHPRGLAQLADRRRTLLLGACALVVVPAAVIGVAGVLAGLLTVTWTGGTLLVGCRRPLAYVVIVLAATPAMIAGVAVLAVLAAVAAATTVAVALALRASAASARPTPGRWERAVAAGAIGTGLGLMLVLDRTVGFTEGAIPALALLPSTVASAWGGHHLRHLEQAIPRAVSGIAASDAYTPGVAWPPFSVLLGALGRLLALSAALSAVLLALTPWLGASGRSAGMLLGFGLVALATLLVSLLEALGRGRWALAAVACAVTAEAAIRLAGSEPFPGTGLVVGGVLAVVLVLPAVIGQLIRPARTLATALWIP
jgi:hypothetical protein